MNKEINIDYSVIKMKKKVFSVNINKIIIIFIPKERLNWTALLLLINIRVPKLTHEICFHQHNN